MKYKSFLSPRDDSNTYSTPRLQNKSQIKLNSNLKPKNVQSLTKKGLNFETAATPLKSRRKNQETNPNFEVKYYLGQRIEVPITKRPKSTVKARPKQSMVTKYIVRPSTPQKVDYKSNNEENRQKYANLAYYIDEEEKGRVLSENMKD